MNKAELINTIAEEAGLSKTDATSALNTILATISNELSSGNEVNLSPFGSFQTSNRAAQTGRNPRTGEAIQIPARRVPKFKPGKGLKDAVRGEMA